MKVTALTRSFAYAGVTLPDPNPGLSVDQVRDVYSATYPELATAAVEGPETRDGKMVYSFRRAAGMKGGDDQPHSYESDVQVLIQFAKDQGWDMPNIMEAVMRLEEAIKDGFDDCNIYSMPVSD
jgi:PRTRC genetic system protein C